MSRPRTNDPRQHQVNVRFTTRELARIHHHASLAGRTVTEFGRAAMLRRPRAPSKTTPRRLGLPPERLARWQSLGREINDLAHGLNAGHQLNPRALAVLLTGLALLLRASFPGQCDAGAGVLRYRLEPAARYHLRKVCTNLVQIRARCRLLHIDAPAALADLIGSLRALLNGDRARHGS
jgi:hypothetical protein